MLKQDAVRERWSVPTLLFLWMLSKWISGWEDGMATSAMPWGICSGQRFEDRDAIVGADGVSVCPVLWNDAERQDLVDVGCVEHARSAMRTGFLKDAGGAVQVSKNAIDSMQSKTGTSDQQEHSRAEQSRVGAKQKRPGGPWGFREQH